MKVTPTKDSEDFEPSFWSILMVVVLCFTGFFPTLLFVVKWLTSDFDTALEYFCTFVNGVFDE